MIRLNSKDIKDTTVAHLSSQQQLINAENTFEGKVQKAESLWNIKSASLAKKAAFDDIKKKLKDACVGVELCVYCEANEATDVEHIFPKKLYPEKAFLWSNYVLACGKCNTHHKSDKFSIFNPSASATIQDVTVPRGTYLKPTNDDACFLNQRNEDPMDLITLDIRGQQFIFIERHNPGTREYIKAKYTIETLKLNEREALRVARKSACRYYLDRLKEYVAVNNSNNFASLKAAIVQDFNLIDETQDFQTQKSRLLSAVKEEILKYAHPTVWKEMIAQRANLPVTNSLLQQAPQEILTWL